MESRRVEDKFFSPAIRNGLGFTFWVVSIPIIIGLFLVAVSKQRSPTWPSS